jgi:hypothetical protein
MRIFFNIDALSRRAVCNPFPIEKGAKEKMKLSRKMSAAFQSVVQAPKRDLHQQPAAHQSGG